MVKRKSVEASPSVRVVHFADPWCWWSWGLEPVLQRLREVYGDRVAIEYRMGGTFSDLQEWMKEYGVDETSTVDWIRELMGMHHMPLDPAYILRTPSTYPACLAFKAAEIQDPQKAERYFRRMMEAFTIEGREGSNAELGRLAKEVELDPVRLERDAK